MSQSKYKIDNAMDALVCTVFEIVKVFKFQDPVLQDIQRVWESTRTFAHWKDDSIHFPKVRRLKRKKYSIEFDVCLPVGLFPDVIKEHKPLLDSALNGDTDIWVEGGNVRVKVHTGKMPNFAKYDPEIIERLKGRGLIIPIGVSRAGIEILNMQTGFCHLLVGGMTDTGKSVFLRQALAAIHELYTPDEVQLVLCDLKMGAEFKLFNGSPFVAQFAKDEKALRSTLKWLNTELDRRAALLEHTPFVNIRQYNEHNDPLPFIILVIDEFAEIPEILKGASSSEKRREQQTENRNTVDRLLRLGRSHGIHCIICTQRPTIKVVPGEVKAQCAATVAFRVRTNKDSGVLLDRSGAEDIEPIPGRAIYQAKRDREVQVFFLDEVGCRKIVRNAINAYPKPDKQTAYEIEV